MASKTYLAKRIAPLIVGAGLLLNQGCTTTNYTGIRVSDDNVSVAQRKGWFDRSYFSVGNGGASLFSRSNGNVFDLRRGGSSYSGNGGRTRFRTSY